MALILVWVYYSSMILFFGAEFTQAWSRKQGHHTKPEPGASRAVEQTVIGKAAAQQSRVE